MAAPAWSTDRERLYVVLLRPRSDPLSTHWVLMISRRSEIEQARRGDFCKGQMYGVWKFKDGDTNFLWGYGEHHANGCFDQVLLRAMVAKVADKTALETIMETTEIKLNLKNWGEIEWAKETLRRLTNSPTALFQNRTFAAWATIEQECIQLVDRKQKEGRYATLDGENCEGEKIPTWDFEQDEETVA